MPTGGCGPWACRPARDSGLRLQNADVRSALAAFVAGVNAYATQHSDRIAGDVKVVLPVTIEDVLAHVQRVIHFTFLANPQAIDAQGRRWSDAGSNTWAVAPARSASGHALLLANPHLPWGDLFTWFEAQLVLPDAMAYGATLVGIALPRDRLQQPVGLEPHQQHDRRRRSVRTATLRRRLPLERRRARLRDAHARR